MPLNLMCCLEDINDIPADWLRRFTAGSDSTLSKTKPQSACCTRTKIRAPLPPLPRMPRRLLARDPPPDVKYPPPSPAVAPGVESAAALARFRESDELRRALTAVPEGAKQVGHPAFYAVEDICLTPQLECYNSATFAGSMGTHGVKKGSLWIEAIPEQKIHGCSRLCHQAQRWKSIGE